MALGEKVKILERFGINGGRDDISWDITPSYTYGLFECRGDLQQRVRSSKERYFYFYIDGWRQPARLCLMERGIRHARVLAYIAAPKELLDSCLAEQGRCKDMSYAINERIRSWLEEYLFDAGDESLLLPVDDRPGSQIPPTDHDFFLPSRDDSEPVSRKYLLRAEPAFIREDEIAGIICAADFFERDHNPTGAFHGCLVDNQDLLTVTDLTTGLTWQRGGTGLLFFRRVVKEAEKYNQQKFAGQSSWRLPTIEEALSLLIPEKNRAGLHLHPCFTSEQGFIYTADRHKPGGYWFVDLRQAKVFWAGGTLSGGFGRFCCGA